MSDYRTVVTADSEGILIQREWRVRGEAWKATHRTRPNTRQAKDWLPEFLPLGLLEAPPEIEAARIIALCTRPVIIRQSTTERAAVDRRFCLESGLI